MSQRVFSGKASAFGRTVVPRVWYFGEKVGGEKVEI